MGKDRYGFKTDETKLVSEDWKSLMSGDKDNDSEYLIRMITHKLYHMRKHFGSVAELTQDPECKRIYHEISLCYKLGYKILTDNYGEFLDILGNIIGVPLDEVNIDSYLSITEKCIHEREADIERFFRNLSKMVNGWYLV